MKNSIFLLAALLLSVSSAFSQQAQFQLAASPISYSQQNVGVILKQVTKNDKMVFLNFYRVRTAACRMTAQLALANDTVAKFMNENFICRKFDVEDSTANKLIMERYNVTDWEFLFLDSTGDVKYRFGGGSASFDSEHFFKQVKNALDRKHMNTTKGVKFIHKSLKAVLDSARNARKLVFVDCYTKWCKPCAEMSAMVFPLKEMGDYFNPKFIATKLDMETLEGVELNKKYHVTSYPTFLILDTKGEELGRILGAMPAEKFIAETEKQLQNIKK